MRKLVTAIAIIAAALSAGCIDNQRSKSRDLWNEGRTAMAEGRAKTALKLFMEAAEIDPSNIGAQISIQDELFRKGQNSLAIQMYSSLYRENRGRPWAVFLYIRATNPKNGRQALEEAVAGHPECGWLHYGLGRLEAKDGNAEKAKALFEKAIVSDDDIPQAYVELGRLFGAERRLKTAEECFKASVRLDPLYSEGYFYCGNSALIRGDYAGAESLYRKAYSLNRRDDRYGNAIGKIFFLKKDYGRAGKIFAGLLESNKRNSRYMLSMARTEFMAGNLDEAEKWIDRAFDMKQHTEEALRLKILLDAARNDPDKIEADLFIAEKFTPESPWLKRAREESRKAVAAGERTSESMRKTIMEEYGRI